MTLSELATLGQIIQSLTSLGLFVIGGWAAWVAVRQLRISATTDLFHRFNDPVARDHRRWVYHHCRELTDQEKLTTWGERPEDLVHLEAVCNTLDWAGLLVRKGLLQKKDAVDLYGDSVLRTWVTLRPWIHHTRRRRSSPKWLWGNFEWLAIEAAKDPRFSSWLSDGVPIYTPKEVFVLDYEDSIVKSVDSNTN